MAVNLAGAMRAGAQSANEQMSLHQAVAQMADDRREVIAKQYTEGHDKFLEEASAHLMQLRRHGGDESALRLAVDQYGAELNKMDTMTSAAGLGDIVDVAKARREIMLQSVLATKPLTESLMPALLRAGFEMDQATALTNVAGSSEAGMKEVLGMLAGRTEQTTFTKTLNELGIPLEHGAQIFEASHQPASTTIKIPPQFPQAPAGWHYEGNFESGDVRLIPTPEGPADRAIKEAAAKEAGRQESQTATAGVMLEEIAGVRDLLRNSEFTTGFSGSILSAVPGTPAHQLKLKLNVLKSAIARDSLQQMRNDSPTGGALGNVSDKDIGLLETRWGAMAQSGSAEELERNLGNFERELNRVVHGKGAEPQQRLRFNPNTGKIE